MLPQRCTVEASRRGRWRSKGERSRRGLHKRRRWEVWSGPAYEVRPCGGVWRGVVHNGAPKKLQEVFVPCDNDRPRPWRPRVKKKKAPKVVKDGFLSATLFITSLKICLIISFVMSSQSLMCSALIPLLSQAFPLLSLLIADCISSAMISSISSLSHSLCCSPSLLDLAAEFIEFGGFRDLHTVCCRIHRLRWEFHFAM